MESLGALGSPTKLGYSSWTEEINSYANGTIVSGECDARASGLEYSDDGGSTWKNVSGISGADFDCSDKTFAFAVLPAQVGFSKDLSARKEIRVRQLFNFGPSQDAIVTLKYTAPWGARPTLENGSIRMMIGTLKPNSGSPIKVEAKAYARGAIR